MNHLGVIGLDRYHHHLELINIEDLITFKQGVILSHLALGKIGFATTCMQKNKF